MTAGVAADATLDVAHEARLRRWTYRQAAGGYTLRSSDLLFHREAPRDRDASLPLVGLGGALRVATAATGEQGLEAAARRALVGGGAEIVAALRASDGMSFGERAGALRVAAPDLVVVLAGEGGGGLVELAEALRFGCAAMAPAPRVVVSGDARTMLRLSAALDGFPTEVLSDPRRPDGFAALLGRAREFRRGADAALILRDEALEELSRALARGAASDVTVLDVTGDSTSVVRCAHDGQVAALHAPRLGLGRAADRVVARAGLDRVRRWIPWAVDAPTLLERVFNRARWPDAVPAEPLALALEIALAHEAITHALDDATTAGLPVEQFRAAPVVVLTGRLAAFPRRAQSLLVAADALQPVGVCAIAREVDDALVACGALAARDRLRGHEATGEIAAEVELRRESLALVASCDPGRGATLRVDAEGARRDERVARGAFYALALRGPVELAGLGVRIRGRGEPGALGLVVDARGRPLALPPRDAERVPTVARWYGALDAMPERAA